MFRTNNKSRYNINTSTERARQRFVNLFLLSLSLILFVGQIIHLVKCTASVVAVANSTSASAAATTTTTTTSRNETTNMEAQLVLSDTNNITASRDSTNQLAAKLVTSDYSDHEVDFHKHHLPQQQQQQHHQNHHLQHHHHNHHHQQPNFVLIDQHNTRMNEINTNQQPPPTRNKLSCSRAMKELDRCSSQLIGLGRQQPMSDATSGKLILYPDSMQDMNTVFCPKFRESVSCIKNQTVACFKPFERQVINWILTSTKKMNYKRCKNENEKIRFLRLTNSCLSTMKDPMDACMANYIGSLDAIADYRQFNNNSPQPDRELEFERLQDNGDDIQIQLACCANRRFKQCIMGGAKQMCNKPNDRLTKLRRTNSNTSQRAARKHLLRSMQDTMDDLKTTLDEMALTGPEFICNTLDEKFCRTKLDGRFTGRISRHRSIVPAMIKIYANK